MECFLRGLHWLPKKCTHLLRVPPSSEGAPICRSSGLLSANELQLPIRLICLLSLSSMVMLGKGKVTQSVSLVCSHEMGKVLLLPLWRLTAVPSLPSLERLFPRSGIRPAEFGCNPPLSRRACRTVVRARRKERGSPHNEGAKALSFP